MALLQSSSTTTRTFISLLLSVSSSSSSSFSSQCRPPIPARDRTITFGKHKGRMLGSLPSKYLTWVSKNLRARDFREWAELADQVLADDVYRDRLEWESAERILSGNDLLLLNTTTSPVSDLLEISQRFGWDNRDKAAWARLDFALLGTSKGGRIPRIGTQQQPLKVDDDDDDYSRRRKKMIGVGVGGKREERRERRRARNVGKEVENGRTCASAAGSGSGKWVNPFPGRGALLDKIKGRRRRKKKKKKLLIGSRLSLILHSQLLQQTRFLHVSDLGIRRSRSTEKAQHKESGEILLKVHVKIKMEKSTNST